MKKTGAKRLMAMAMTVCMVLAMVAVPASALTTYDLTLTITEAKATGADGKTTITAKSADVSQQADLTTELVALLVSKFEGDAKANKSGLWDFESDAMGITIEKGLSANRKGEAEWFAWIDQFADDDSITSGNTADDKASLLGLLKNKATVGDMNFNQNYVLKYAPTENLKEGDPAIGNTYTFTMRLNRTITGGGGISGGGSGGSSGSSSGGGASVNKDYAITVNDCANAVVTTNVAQAQAGAKITVAVKVNEGYAVDDVVVRQQGVAGLLTVIDNGDGNWSFTMPAGAVTVTVTTKAIAVNPYDPSAPGHSDSCHADGYSDVELNAWYHGPVCYVLDKGLMAGYNANAFGPDDALSRAMVAQILYNMEGQPKGEYEVKFPDVADGMWYHDAITWVFENGVVSGYGDGLYRPDKDVSREELVVMLWNYAGKQASNAKDHVDSFNDASKLSDWAKDAMNWALEIGILGGKGGKMLDPTGMATRAEMAQMLKNYIEHK